MGICNLRIFWNKCNNKSRSFFRLFPPGNVSFIKSEEKELDTKIISDKINSEKISNKIGMFKILNSFAFYSHLIH